ncbi:hypothetical protein [Paenibacillus terrigena]|uniref:hypothetical protein n=1 Tax=Paenibacillus terrigena TaxID=369333 RepID=UPI0028D3A0F0|nr:hypothetical protein [Paenibacillus terrigena]
MAVFQSKYRELSFYVNGERHSFSSGSFSTDDAEVIAVLEALVDAKRVYEPEKSEDPETQPEEKPEEPESKPEDKPSTRRKASAK